MLDESQSTAVQLVAKAKAAPMRILSVSSKLVADSEGDVCSRLGESYVDSMRMQMCDAGVSQLRQEGEVLQIRVVLAQLHALSTSRNLFLVRFSAIFPEDINSVHTLTYWCVFYPSISSPVCFRSTKSQKEEEGC